jgi:hypothetical protein
MLREFFRTASRTVNPSCKGTRPRVDSAESITRIPPARRSFGMRNPRHVGMGDKLKN